MFTKKIIQELTENLDTQFPSFSVNKSNEEIATFLVTTIKQGYSRWNKEVTQSDIIDALLNKNHPYPSTRVMELDKLSEVLFKFIQTPLKNSIDERDNLQSFKKLDQDKKNQLQEIVLLSATSLKDNNLLKNISYLRDIYLEHSAKVIGKKYK